MGARGNQRGDRTRHQPRFTAHAIHCVSDHGISSGHVLCNHVFDDIFQLAAGAEQGTCGLNIHLGLFLDYRDLYGVDVGDLVVFGDLST